MSHRRPDDDRLGEAIRAVVSREKHIRSQRTLTELVLNELRSEDGGYRVSGERIRKVAIERDILKIDIEYNQHDDRSSPDVCPVCGYPMATVRNSRLGGGAAGVGRRCTVCPYQTGLKRRTPGVYIFTEGTSRRDGTGAGARISLLREASGLMRRAASMVESATKGTEHAKRGKNGAGRIKRMSSSKKDEYSIANLIRDMDAGSGDPGRVRPPGSVKDGNRKDI